MDIDYIQKLPPAERRELLRGDAIEIREKEKYTKPLTEEEVTFYKSELTDNCILQAMILEEKKLAVAAFKDRLEPVEKKITTALKAAQYRAIDCEGTLYMLADYDQKMMHTVDEDGNLVNSRQMLPKERQLRIAALKQESA
jgi:hypothetical protein